VFNNQYVPAFKAFNADADSIPCYVPSEDDADERSYSQDENRCEGKNPNRPKFGSILIGKLLFAERCGHRDLLLMSTGPT
jgi:hypothetical protein